MLSQVLKSQPLRAQCKMFYASAMNLYQASKLIDVGF